MIKSRIFRQTLTLGFCITLIASASAEANEALIKPPQELQRLRSDITGTVGNTFAAFNRRIGMLGVYDADGDGLKNPQICGMAVNSCQELTNSIFLSFPLV